MFPVFHKEIILGSSRENTCFEKKKKKQGVSHGVKEFLLAKVQAICSLVSYFKIFHLATNPNFKTCGQHLRIQPAKLDIRIFYGKRV